MPEDKHDDKDKKNIRALRAFRLKGEVIAVGEVVKKSEFAKKGEWQNLCHMDPAKAEETNDDVGKPKAEKATAKGGMPPAKK